MKHSERFTNAVTKLYNAFHENRLDAGRCEACAVGNICDNNQLWAGMVISHTDGRYDLKKGDTMPVIKNTGYSAFELAKIEQIFLKSTGYKSRVHNKKENQFKGLFAVIEYLCELEGIPNIMDYTCLFETADDQPKHQLQEVFN